MRTLLSIAIAVVTAACGCLLAHHLIPAGMPRYLADCASVLAGFGVVFGGLRLYG